MTDSTNPSVMAPYELREQDKWLPIANVCRIMKSSLPATAKISKEAKECMQECVSEFVSFITSEATEKCNIERRKTVNGEDVLFALTSLGFENYAEVLKIYLAKYRNQLNIKQEELADKRRRVRQMQSQKRNNQMQMQQSSELEGSTSDDSYDYTAAESEINKPLYYDRTSETANSVHRPSVLLEDEFSEQYTQY